MGLDAFSHCEVVFLFDRVPDEKIETGARLPSVPVLVDLADALALDDALLGQLARTLTKNGAAESST